MQGTSAAASKLFQQADHRFCAQSKCLWHTQTYVTSNPLWCLSCMTGKAGQRVSRTQISNIWVTHLCGRPRQLNEAILDSCTRWHQVRTFPIACRQSKYTHKYRWPELARSWRCGERAGCAAPEIWCFTFAKTYGDWTLQSIFSRSH